MSDNFQIPQSESGSPLDPNEIDGLIPPLTTYEEINQAEALNVSLGTAWVMNRKKKIAINEILTEVWCRKLHKQMFSDVWSWAGTFRCSQKNIGLIGWTRIPIELKIALDNARVQTLNMDKWNLSYQDIAVQLAHKVVWVHPFPNGNGRWSRLLTDAYLFANHQAAFSWGNNTYSIQSERRKEYVDALKIADNGGSLDRLKRFAVI